MPFRFRRTFKILPGVRLNLGKGGSSISIGQRGAHVTVGSTGIRGTVGLPGSGLSYTEHIPWSKGGDKPKAASRQHWAAGLVSGPLPLDSPFLSEEQLEWNARVHITPRGTPLAGPSRAELDAIEEKNRQELAREISRARVFRRLYFGLLAVIGLAFLISFAWAVAHPTLVRKAPRSSIAVPSTPASVAAEALVSRAVLSWSGLERKIDETIRF